MLLEKQWVYCAFFRKFIIDIVILAKEVQRIGALAVYESNLRNANVDLLKAGNFTEVPSREVLNTIKQQYNKRYRLDEDCFRELRMFRFFTRYTDRDSEDVKGENFYTLLIIDTFMRVVHFFYLIK